MPELIQIFGPAFLTCIITAAILGHLGIHVLKREVIFVDIAVAQMAAVGSIMAHTVFHAPQMAGFAGCWLWVVCC